VKCGIRSPRLFQPGTSTLRTLGAVQARVRPRLGSSAALSGKWKWVFSKTMISPFQPGISRMCSIVRLTAATLVMPWFHHCADTLITTTSSTPITLPMPPSLLIAASMLPAGPPPLATAIVVASLAASWGRSGGVAENDASTVLRSMKLRMRLRITHVAPARPATAPAPRSSLRRLGPREEVSGLSDFSDILAL
jgi:hypothetical protein